jgi:SOS-response transcriptional repressor LexA
MTHDPMDRPTWDGEALAEALGRTYARMNEEVWTDEAFLAWLAAETRARGGRRARAAYDAGAMLASGRALRELVLSRRYGVGIVRATPRTVAALQVDTPLGAMDHAQSSGAIPFIDMAAAAGPGRELWDEPVDDWLVLPDGVPRMRALALRISGESMVPLLHHGDTVLVELGTPVTKGRVVVARHPDDGYVCKRVHRVGRRDIELASLNPAYAAVTIPRDERLVVGTVRAAWRAKV